MPKKVIVTGGAGFIGSHVVDKLLAIGAQVTVLDNFSTGRPENLNHLNQDVRLIESDISKIGAWEREFEGTDWVIHLAALADIVPSIQSPDDYFNANVVGTYNILQTAKAYGVSRLVYSASSSCYGLADIFPTPENAPINAQYPYALTKRIGEELVLHWAKVFGLGALSLRFFNVYGPRSRTSGTYGAMFGVFLAQKLAGKPFTVVGDGNQTRDFTFVTDIADAVLAACQSSSRGDVYNVGSGNTISVNDIVKKMGGEVVHIPKRPGEPDCTFADISAIKRDLGWSPKIGIDEGISLVLENIEYWRDARVWTPATIAEATKDWFRYLSND